MESWLEQRGETVLPLTVPQSQVSQGLYFSLLGVVLFSWGNDMSVYIVVAHGVYSPLLEAQGT